MAVALAGRLDLTAPAAVTALLIGFKGDFTFQPGRECAGNSLLLAAAASAHF